MLREWGRVPLEVVLRFYTNQLYSVAIHLLRGLRKEDEASGIGPARLSALSVLVFAGSRTLGELAAAEQVKPPTMTRIVKGLEADGLARRRADPDDLRVVHVRATARGARLMQEARARRVGRLEQLLEGASPGELREIAGAVQTIERALGARSRVART